MTRRTGITIKKPDELEKIREGGHLLAVIRDALADMANPGVTTAQLDGESKRRMHAVGAEPSFLGYRIAGIKNARLYRPFKIKGHGGHHADDQKKYQDIFAHDGLGFVGF